MKCPLLSSSHVLEDKTEILTLVTCLKKDCPRWSEELKRCDPTGLLSILIALGNTLGKIADRMPKDLAPGGR